MDGLEAVLVPDLHLGYFQEWNHFFRADIIFDYFKAEIVGSDAADSASNKFPAAGLDHQNQVLLRFGRNDTEKSRELRLKKSAVEGEIAPLKNDRFRQRRRGRGNRDARRLRRRGRAFDSH